MAEVDLSRRLALSLHRAAALVDRVADVHLRPTHGYGVSVLAAMVTIDAVGPARQSVLADALGVSRAAVTQRLAALVERGFVQVGEDPTNRGARLVSLTAAGRREVAHAWRTLAAADDGLEDGVDLGDLLAGLETLSANADRFLAGGSRR